MTNSVAPDCFINGVQYKCRTCFDPGSTIFPLANECSDTKTWRDLLRDIAQLKTDDNDSLPKTVCCKCLDKLINYYDFILQIRSVNKKYTELLGSCNDPLQVQIKDEIITVEEANEITNDIPLEHPISEIKLEEECIASYDTFLAENNENCTKGLKTLAEYQYAETIKITDLPPYSGEIEENISLNDDYNFYGYESSLSTSSENEIDDESVEEPLKMFIIEKRNQTANTNMSNAENSDSCKKIEEVNGSFNCPLCINTFSAQEKCIEHIIKVHSLELTNNTSNAASEKIEKVAAPIKKVDDSFMCRICKETFSLPSSCIQHIRTMHTQHKPIKCDFCEKEFQFKESFRRHLRRHHLADIRKAKEAEECNRELKPIIQCGLCEKSFQRLRHLHQHMTIHADGKTGIDLTKCLYRKTFESSEIINYLQLQKQIKEAFRKGDISRFYQASDKFGNELYIADSDSDMEDIKVKSYNCEVCKEVFGRRITLLQHQEKFHNEEVLPYTCRNCNKDFVCHDLLQQHFKKDCCYVRRLKTHQCEFCSARFIWSDNLLRHREVQHKILTKPPISATSFFPDQEIAMTANSLQQPLNDVLTYYCLMCPKTFFKAEDLNDHFSRHLLSPSAIKTVESIMNSTWWPNGDKQIICKTCDFRFKTMSDLSKHYQNSSCAKNKRPSLQNYSITNRNGFELHLELDSETEAEIETEDNKITLYSYKCNMCYKVFKRKYQLAQHQRSMHNYEFLELKCELCIFRTVSRKVLDYHKATQCFNVDKQFKCDQCNFKFMWKDNLENHIAICHSLNNLPEVTISNPQNDTLSTSDNIVISNVVTSSIEDESDANVEDDSMDSQELLMNELPSTSSNSNVKKELTTRKKRLSCKLCNVTCVGSAHLEVHMRTHTAHNSFTEKGQDALDDGEEKLSFSDKNVAEEAKENKSLVKNDYASHLLKIKIGQIEKVNDRFLCPMCDTTFSTKASCSRHLCRTHRNDFSEESSSSSDEILNETDKIIDDGLSRFRKNYTRKLRKMKVDQIEKVHDRFSCPICKETFSLKATCVQHIYRIHLQKNRLKCNICGKDFKYTYTLKQHISRNHPKHDESTLQCGLCEQTFNKLLNLRQHIYLHADGKTGIDFKNCLYIKTFEEAETIDYQMLQQQIRDDYAKGQINIYYQATDKYGNELDISDSDCDLKMKMYMCEVCKKEFQKRKLLLKHQQKYHNGVTLPYKCKDCNQQYVNNDLLVQHFKRNCSNGHRRTVHKCDSCDAHFIWPNNLAKHKVLKHNLFIEPSVDISNEEPALSEELLQHDTTSDVHAYYCLMCPKTFLKAEDLNDHLGQHLLTSSDIRTVESIINSTLWPNGDKQIMCKICDLSFKTMADLSKHYQNSSCVKNNKHSLKNYSITNQNGFELHLEFDSETEAEAEDIQNCLLPYKCSICNKPFKRKYQLAQHQRSLHNYELLVLKCDICIFRTVTQKVLDYHKATQCFNAEKQFKCSQCNFKFMWEENLNNHVAKSHTSNLLAQKSILYVDSQEQPNFESVELRITQSNSNGDEGPKDTDKPFKCSSCKTGFKTTDLLYEHRRVVHINENIFQCILCDVSFEEITELKVHKRNHSKVHKCNVCNIVFTSPQYLKEHRELTGHRELRPLKKKNKNLCPHCGNYVQDIKRHIQAHIGEKNLKCAFCDKRFIFKKHLEHHQSRHTGERPHKCSLCDKAFVDKQHLKVHFRVHTGERPYECKYCKKTFSRSGNYIVHVRMHTGEKNYKCEICGEAFTCGAYLKKHRITKHRMEKSRYFSIPNVIYYRTIGACGLTGILCATLAPPTTYFKKAQKSILYVDSQEQPNFESVELRITQSNSKGDEGPKDTDKPFKCSSCKTGFKTTDLLYEHRRVVHINENIFQCILCDVSFEEITELKVHKRNHSKVHKCNVCNIVFTSPQYLKEHRELTGHRELRPLKKKNKNLCPHCGNYVQDIKRHIQAHIGEKNLKCAFCDKRFIFKKHLEHHQSRHTGERPHKCSLCDKAFVDKQHLKVHFRVHTGERPYECKYCKKTFSRSGNYIVHVRMHTGEKNYKCEICGEAFTCGAYLKKHRITKHRMEK